jgi:hypothetical protein
MLADHAPARTRPSVASNMRALLARSAARRGVLQRRVDRFDRPSMASGEARADIPLRSIARAGCAQTGPVEHGERTTE